MTDQPVASSDVKPSAIALVVCDAVYKESSGKRALVGLFNRITAAKFPHQHRRMSIYVSVTGVRPHSTLTMEIENTETDEIVVQAEGRTSEKVSPLDIFDMVFEFANVVFRAPGLYLIRFSGNKHPLLQRPFMVVQEPGEKQ